MFDKGDKKFMEVLKDADKRKSHISEIKNMRNIFRVITIIMLFLCLISLFASGNFPEFSFLFVLIMLINMSIWDNRLKMLLMYDFLLTQNSETKSDE